MENFKGIKIRGTGSYAPENIVTNEELAGKFGTDPEWIFNNLGIRSRHIGNEPTSDLAAKAAKNAIDAADCDKESIDLIIVATGTPDRKSPSTACIVKNKLGIKNHCPAFDLAAVCSGFVYSLNLAASQVRLGLTKRALVIGADCFSTITDWDRRDCIFFGDGAGAVIVEAASSDCFYHGLAFSETENVDNFTVFPEDSTFTMNAKAVYETGSKVLPVAIRQVLSDVGLGVGDVDIIIPHQPSKRLLMSAANELGVDFSLFKTNMERYANTSGGTVPIILDETVRAGGIKAGDHVVFAAVGSGWTWAASIMEWS